MIPWLIVWLALTALLLAGLLFINLYARWRSLAAEDVPSPALIIWRQAFGRLLPARAEPISRFVGRRAFVSWDIRWVTAGITLAEVTGADPKAGELELHLANPIHLGAVGEAPEVYLDKVRFQPRNNRDQVAYGARAVSGRLLPSVGEDLYASASIVVYPSGA